MHAIAAAIMALGIGVVLGIICYVAAAVIVGLACAAYFFGVAAIFKRKNVDQKRKEKIMTKQSDRRPVIETKQPPSHGSPEWAHAKGLAGHRLRVERFPSDHYVEYRDGKWTIGNETCRTERGSPLDLTCWPVRLPWTICAPIDALEVAKREAVEWTKTEEEKRKANMTDEQIKAINEVAEAMHANACDKGFHDTDTDPLSVGRIAEFIANLHEETSELWSAARKGALYKQCDKPVPLTCAAEELADIVIRAMDTAVGMGIDLGSAIAAKHRYNQTRSRMHGKLA
jgi:NTP pyrophosphatase (non-canonical NTP hydrolase)